MTTTTRRDRRQWRAARTLADLGQLMARWIEGELQTAPHYYGPTDLDTPELTALCAALCRAGYLTVNSQTADVWEWDDRGRTLRARTYLDGFAEHATLTRLRAACAGTGLMLLAHRTPPRRWFRRHPDTDSVPVVTDTTGREYRTLGGPVPRRYVAMTWPTHRAGGPAVHPDAQRAVLAAWQVTIIDPEWGRNELLLDVLGDRFVSGCAGRPADPLIVAPLATGHP